MAKLLHLRYFGHESWYVELKRQGLLPGVLKE